MDQSLEVFWDSFHSFYIFGIQKCKNQRFFVKKYFRVHFYQIEVLVFTNIKHLKFDIRQIFYAFFKKNGKNHIFREF